MRMAEELNVTTEGQETETQDTVTMTQKELDELLQKTGDKRVTEALKKADKKNQDKVREAQRLASMNESQKFEYELQQREAAIEAKEKELALMENKNEASKILADKGIDLALVDFVVAEDAETMDANIKMLETAFKKSVKAEVEKRLASKAPVKSLATDNTITAEQFKKLTLAQMQELANNEPELYNSLTRH